MSAQTRFGLAKSARTTMKDAKLIGPADANENMEVTIYLRRGSPGVYPNIAQQASSPVKERRHLSREEFAKAHGASSDDIAKVRQFASQFGLQVKAEDPARRSVVLSGLGENSAGPSKQNWTVINIRRQALFEDARAR